MANTIALRRPQQGALIDPLAAAGVALLSVTYQINALGACDFNVLGVSVGAQAIDVTLATGGVASTVAVVPDAGSGAFEAAVMGVVIPADGVVHVLVAITGGQERDQAILRIEPRARIDLPSGTVANIPADRSRFVASVPDRVVETPSFAPLNHFVIPAVLDKLILASGQAKFMAVSQESVTKAIASDVKEFAEAVQRGDSKSSLRARRVKALAEAVSGTATRITKKSRLSSHVTEFKSLMADDGKAPSSRGLPRRTMMIKAKSGSGMFSQDPVMLVRLKDLSKFWKLYLEHADQKSRVGIMFADRLRFQPVGLAPGEQLYTLSLAPGEEVQLRQTVETKRRQTAEEINDREEEKSMSLSSTWTTDLSETVTDSSSVQNSVSMGASASISVPGVPISGGPDAQFSTSNASQSSATAASRNSQQRTGTAAAKMRSQHKTRIEITDETASALSTTRTIRNANQQRASTFVFHKVYRKERVTLERYNARLCLRLVVDDPAASVRAAFLQDLRRLDPNDPSNYWPTMPEMIAATGSLQINPDSISGVGMDDAEANDGYQTWFATFATELLNISRGPGGPIPDTYWLSQPPSWDVTFTRDGEVFEGYTKFQEYGGSLWIEPPPPPLLQARPSIKFKGVLWRAEGATKSIDAYSILINTKTVWVPPQADLLAARQQQLLERDKIVERLSVEAIQQLRDNAVRDFPTRVLDRVMSEQLSIRAGMMSMAKVFDIGGTVLEVVPHWATSNGRQIFDLMQRQLGQLPIALAATEILVDALTASQVIVYLPVREGFEAEALATLDEVPAAERVRLADEVTALRAAEYPLQVFPAPAWASVQGPAAAGATPPGAAQWANDWEKPQRGYQVLGQWSELVPTDGVHTEVLLSATVGTDEHREHQLEQAST